MDFNSPPSHGSHVPTNIWLSTENDGYKETHIDAATTSTLLPASREEPRKPRVHSSVVLRFVSVILHFTLVAIHLALLGLRSRGWEHRFIFSLERQSTVSLIITVITTAFGTIYSALLVFVTQTLSTRRSVRRDQTLTAIHDTAAAWSGIGSAVLHLWNQTVVSGSVFGVLSALLYLGSVLVLHITTPALFSVQTFSSTREVPVGARSLPAFNVSDDNVTSEVIGNFGILYAAGSLYSLPSIVRGNKSVGLYEGTLYDVLEDNTGVGNVTVNATGFNITCGYSNITNSVFQPFDDNNDGTGVWDVYLGASDADMHVVQNTQLGVISSRLVSDPLDEAAVLLYSTIPIIDSSGNAAHVTQLPSNFAPSISARAGAPAIPPSPPPTIQILKCSQTLVAQKAVVDAQTHQLQSVEPNITKTSSVWLPADETATNATSGNLFIDNWPTWFRSMPDSIFNLYPPKGSSFASIGDLYLIQKLNLHTSSLNPNESAQNAALHDLENALSILVASMFWTLANTPPAVGDVDGTLDFSFIAEPEASPLILQGNAQVTEIFTQGRLNLSLIAIVAGLSASILLILLSLPSLFLPKGYKDGVDIDGTGILQAIWLYRNHPELETLLPQAEEPTTNNLRQAGMVRARLIDPRRSQQSL
ncbi:hypothetical protein B0H17DRAFT_1061878 [Mycena rosella]|uniref:Uncharacterized protein n=1 Tax=Mycena rosella TaxID=1033263 RepID=A0AAD7DIE6_MYCRO|nr:hypothetical protein B0H17DRAFT_1061878 [Mycena rosella]